MRGGGRADDILPDGVDHFSRGDPWASLDLFCGTGEWLDSARMDYGRLDEMASAGAAVMRLHPSYPNLMAEIEISRGCDRQDSCGVRCSFCTEGTRDAYTERSAGGVASEIGALRASGMTSFRLGRCSNILAWGGERTPFGYRPNPHAIDELYSAIRCAVPNPRVLHTDNCNPATVARFPSESEACVRIIAERNTEGDGLSLGIECLDPAVREANGLKVSLEEAVTVVRIINDAGGARRTARSMPSLLPGINFLAGLAGESKDSFEWNRSFLNTLLDEGLAVRRINIRRAMIFPGTGLDASLESNPPNARERDYRRWKEWVRREVDPVMLGRVAPNGTILRDVILEERSGNVIFGRPLGSYPPLVGVASQDHEPGERIDVMVTDRGSRSLTAVPWPLDINRCSRAELTALPGVGRARAERILDGRPFHSAADMKRALCDMDDQSLALLTQYLEV
jgi:radical SAM superfamily enzyme with C-terminal helix-hairpin-helix motif